MKAKKSGFLAKIPRISFNNFKNKTLSRVIFFFLTLVACGFLGYRFKDKFLAGTVNGQPIFRFQLSSRLYSQYGRQVLEDLVVEKLVRQEARKNNVSISRSELDEAITQIEKSLGQGTDLNSILALQGIKRQDFENQVRIQILVKKLLEPQIEITDDEVKKYLEENKSFLTATGEAERLSEAQGKLKDQKMSEKLNSWISDLVQKAKVLRFVQ